MACAQSMENLCLKNNMNAFFNIFKSLINRSLLLGCRHKGILLGISIQYLVVYLIKLAKINTEVELNKFFNDLRGAKLLNAHSAHGSFDVCQFLHKIRRR